MVSARRVGVLEENADFVFSGDYDGECDRGAADSTLMVANGQTKINMLYSTFYTRVLFHTTLSECLLKRFDEDECSRRHLPCAHSLSQQHTTLTTPSPIDVAGTVGATQMRA